MDPRELAAENERHWRRIALPLPEKHAVLAYEEHFTAEESTRLLRCVLPGDMADKWIVLVDDFELRFHRSWTGFCVYVVTLVNDREDDDFDDDEPIRYCACDAVVNRDPDQYSSTDDAHDAALVSWLIRTLLLEQQVELPADPAATPDDALLAAWGFAGNAAFFAPGSDVTNVGDSDPEVELQPSEPDAS